MLELHNSVELVNRRILTDGLGRDVGLPNGRELHKWYSVSI